MTRLGHRVYREKVVQEVDPRGRPYYWIGAGPPEWREDEASDIAAVHAGWVSVTPLHLDLTHFGALGRMSEWEGVSTPFSGGGADDRSRQRRRPPAHRAGA